jgi:hypothetical protein
MMSEAGREKPGKKIGRERREGEKKSTKLHSLPLIIITRMRMTIIG